MPERSGIEIVGEDKFSPTFRKFEEALKKSEVSSATFARALRTTAKEAERTAAAIEKDAMAAYSLGEITAKQAAQEYKYAEAIRTRAKALRDRADAADKSAKTEVKSQKGIASALGGVALKYASAAAIAYTFQRKISESVDIASANQAAMQGLASSTGIAQREFGSAIGTTARWKDRVRELSDELRIYSDTVVAQAITRTVDMTKRLGLSEQQMVEVVRRAGDLGAGKTDLTGAVERVTAALRGEAESSEYLGLTLSETYVKTNAARLGFNKAWKDMSELEKAQVRYAAFLEQTNEVIGRAADSTSTLAGAEAEARKEYERAAQQLGEAILPLKTELVEVEVKLIQVLGKAAETFKQLVALAHAGTAAVVETVKGLGQGVIDAVKGQGRPLEEVWSEAAEAGAKKYEETILKYVPLAIEEAAETMPPEIPAPEIEPPDYEAIAKAAESTLDSIQRMQTDHLRQLQREEEDAARERARAWRDYEKQVAKSIKSGEKKLVKITTDYEEDRAEAIADYQEAVADAEADAQKDRLKAQQDYERQARQSAERFRLSQLQSERRYQFERGQLVAEGDTLAIEELDARYKLEQKETVENERLRQRQDEENQASRIREAGEAARDQLRELEQQLAEQLSEQETNYREQIEQQREANQERLAEMAADFAERQRLEDEDRRLATQRRNEDYHLQLQELGTSLSNQLREQEFGAENVTRLLEQYYGPGGVADTVLEGYHARELARISITEDMLRQMGQAAPTIPTPTYTARPYATTAGYGPGLQHGGVVTGPASFHVEAGLREAVIPLGGTMQHNFSPLDVNIHGLAGAAQSDINAIAGAIAREMTAQVRGLRRS